MADIKPMGTATTIATRDHQGASKKWYGTKLPDEPTWSSRMAVWGLNQAKYKIKEGTDLQMNRLKQLIQNNAYV